MSAPPDPGSTDGEPVEHDGRTWRWSTRCDAWLPAVPELFETVRATSSATVWIYIPADDEWVDLLLFPDEDEADWGTTIVRGDP